MCAPVLPCREMHRGNNHYVSKVTRPDQSFCGLTRYICSFVFAFVCDLLTPRKVTHVD